MSRTSRKRSRQLERQPRSKGPKILSKTADDKIQEKATELVNGLMRATIDHGSVAAASMLIEMAECVEYADNPAVYKRMCSMAEQWLREPQVAMLETAPQLPAPPAQLQLTSGEDAGAGSSGALPSAGPEEILDAEVD